MISRWESRTLRRLLALPVPAQRFIGGSPAPGLDPAVAMLLRVQRWRGVPGLTARTPARTRHRVRHATALTAGPPTAVAQVHRMTVAGRLRARRYVPPHGSSALLVFFHGGGFVAGDLDTHDEVCRLLCAHAGVQVLAVDYALAPENPFPAAVDDALAAVEWAFSHAASIGVDPARIGVGGDSAGGNLAAVVCALLRGSGTRVAAQVLLYPLLDLVGDWPSRARFGRGLVLTSTDIACFRAWYLAGCIGPEDVRHSPVRAADVGGLPPAVVVTAGCDPLRDEGEAYAKRLRAAGGGVRAWRVEGMVHAFMNLTGVSEAARAAVVRIAGVVREELGGDGARAGR